MGWRYFQRMAFLSKWIEIERGRWLKNRRRMSLDAAQGGVGLWDGVGFAKLKPKR